MRSLRCVWALGALVPAPVSKIQHGVRQGPTPYLHVPVVCEWQCSWVTTKQNTRAINRSAHVARRCARMKALCTCAHAHACTSAQVYVCLRVLGPAPPRAYASVSCGSSCLVRPVWLNRIKGKRASSSLHSARHSQAPDTRSMSLD